MKIYGCVCALALIAAGCGTISGMPPPTPPAASAVVIPPPPPVRPAGPTVLARTNDFIILRAQSGDSFASLAETYLHDAALAEILADANGASGPTAGQPVIIPLKADNASGVFADGYQTVPILCYHQFSMGRSTDLMIMPRDSFIAQMEYLKANKYHVISLADLEGFLNAMKPIPPRSVVITVDDGFRSAYDIAYPILKTYGFHATYFIYTDFFGGGRALTWPIIEEMRSSGLIDIQSHSKTHTSFTPATADNEKTPAYAARIKTEIDPPQTILERQLGTKIQSFAYPYGDASRVAVQYLHDRGYQLAVTVERGGNASFSDPLLLRRDMIYGNYTIADFQKVLRVYTRANLK